MKKVLVVLFAGLLIAFSIPAMAALVSLQPESPTVAVGESLKVGLIASLAPGEYIDWYDIDVSFEVGDLGFDTYMLGDTMSDDSEDFSRGNYTTGLANVAQLAWGDVSDQAGSILLASLYFDALAFGQTRLGFGDQMQVNYGQYEYQEGLDLSFEGATVNVVPIPGAIWLLGAGLISLVGLRRRKKKAM
jgi:hypothetical protein